MAKSGNWKKKLENGVVTTDGKFKANLSDCQLLDTDIEIPKKLIMKEVV